ncbi:hypothetical protein IJM16_03085 [Candidatus Saccharibacteria bacterium]|nr:hypothetical protein [Candidatus Saccharibacteria bacterium]
MPVPDETNNFATHGKAPIPSDANGSFVIPRDKEVGPKDDNTTSSPPTPIAVAPPVVTVPPATNPVGIAAPPAGAAFVSAPSPSATMTPNNAPAPTLGVSPFAAQPMAPQIPLAISAQQLPMMPQQPQVAQQIIPSQPQELMQVQQSAVPIPMPAPQPDPAQLQQIQQMQHMQHMQQQMQEIQQEMQQMQQQMPMMQAMPQQMPMQPMQQAPVQMQQVPVQQVPVQQMPAPITAPPESAIMSAAPAVALPAEMTPSRVAQMQAQILANALLASQNASRVRRKQTYQKAEPEVDENDQDFENEPTQRDIRDEKPPEHAPSNITHGERIILPIHDMTLEKHREDMSRRMTELLGDTDLEPEAISTKSMKKKLKESAKMRVRNATQASEDIEMTEEQIQQAEAQAQAAAQQAQNGARQVTPAEQFPTYTLSGEAIAPQDPIIDPLNRPQRAAVPPIQPQPALQPQIYTLETQVRTPNSNTEQQQNYVEQEYQPKTPSNSSDITSQMQAVQIQAPTAEQLQSMDPRIAALQQQRLMIAEQRKLEQQQLDEQARALAAARRLQAQQLEDARAVLPRVQANSGRLNPNRKSIRVNADVVKKAALASIIKHPEPEPEPEPVAAIRPAYVTELEEQLAGDMKKKDESEMSALMAAELADDEITQNAQQREVEILKEDAKKAATETKVAMPDEILQALENVSPVSNSDNPNIGNPNIQNPNISNAE